jgi:predicted RNase H-like HicB family nuclease
MAEYNFQIVVEQDEDGIYVASVPALPGCYTQGNTFEEALTNIKDVIEMVLEEFKEEGKEVPAQYPEVIGLKRITVTV